MSSSVAKKSTGAGLIAVIISMHEQFQTNCRQATTQAMSRIAQSTSKAFWVTWMAGVRRVGMIFTTRTVSLASFCGIGMVKSSWTGKAICGSRCASSTWRVTSITLIIEGIRVSQIRTVSETLPTMEIIRQPINVLAWSAVRGRKTSFATHGTKNTYIVVAVVSTVATRNTWRIAGFKWPTRTAQTFSGCWSKACIAIAMASHTCWCCWVCIEKHRTAHEATAGVKVQIGTWDGRTTRGTNWSWWASFTCQWAGQTIISTSICILPINTSSCIALSCS